MSPDRIVRILWSDRQLNLFVANAICPPPATHLQIGINNLEHARRFEQTASWLNPDSFLSFAKRHCEKPDHYLFTVADADGPLLGYALAQANAAESRFSEVNQRVRWPQLTGTLYSDYVNPRARRRGIHDILRRARIRFLTDDRGMQWVVTAVETHNLAAMHSARAAGYLRPVATLRTRYRFGVSRRTVDIWDQTFNANFMDAER